MKDPINNENSKIKELQRKKRIYSGGTGGIGRDVGGGASRGNGLVNPCPCAGVGTWPNALPLPPAADLCGPIVSFRGNMCGGRCSGGDTGGLTGGENDDELTGFGIGRRLLLGELAN